MVKSTENTEHYTWGKACDGWHLLKSATLSVIQERMPPGTSEQLHYHSKSQQVFFILSGTATFEAGNNIHIVLANQSIHILPGVIHRIYNKSEEDLHFIVISEPETQGDRVNLD